ncbi:Sushi, von Willebrand factor type A, EGF and pentraxin domain-containing protein 1 [Nymphon striatum]|nr:Sushi, von Willebrand factor type A, EGF and pentraxin domain-containing protein 1 [Nymphon striatum]
MKIDGDRWCCDLCPFCVLRDYRLYLSKIYFKFYYFVRNLPFLKSSYAFHDLILKERKRRRIHKILIKMKLQEIFETVFLVESCYLILLRCILCISMDLIDNFSHDLENCFHTLKNWTKNRLLISAILVRSTCSVIGYILLILSCYFYIQNKMSTLSPPPKKDLSRAKYENMKFSKRLRNRYRWIVKLNTTNNTVPELILMKISYVFNKICTHVNAVPSLLDVIAKSEMAVLLIPVQNSGLCVDITEGLEGNTFQCLCPFGYKGEVCQESFDPCDSSPCLNNGSCKTKGSSYECICPEHYSGTSCQNEPDPCSSNPCVHGICRSTHQHYQCYCYPGFGGGNCEFEYDECDSNPCINGGICEDSIAGYSCHCPPGFTGNHCQIHGDLCASDPCSKNQICVSRGDHFTCSCPDGFTGNNCEMNYDPCEPSPCENGGSCWLKYGSFYCACKPGFAGQKCEEDILLPTIHPTYSFSEDEEDPIPDITRIEVESAIKTLKIEKSAGEDGISSTLMKKDGSIMAAELAQLFTN